MAFCGDGTYVTEIKQEEIFSGAYRVTFNTFDNLHDHQGLDPQRSCEATHNTP